MAEEPTRRVSLDDRLDAKDRQRLITAAITISVIVLVLLFIVGNRDKVDVWFVFFTAQASLIWVILLSMVAGAVLAWAGPKAFRRRFRKEEQ